MTLNADELCRRTESSFDASADLYSLRSFGMDFHVSPGRKEIIGLSPGSEVFLKRLGFFFRLSVLGYFALGKDVALSGRLVQPI
ncbi:MAG TPA: hypothetical protein VN328_05400, partial [Thermodesulfovibrionales bacterium]|nr:hypothetical protein [Thermodesulfovibrionales bacterium]